MLVNALMEGAVASVLVAFGTSALGVQKAEGRRDGLVSGTAAAVGV